MKSKELHPREEILLVFKEAEIVLKEIEGENGEMYGEY